MFELLAGWTADMWSPLINLFSFIPNYAWMIIVFTIVLKIVLSPLDFWQRKVSRDSVKKQAKLQPEMARLQKKYGNNKQIMNQKTMELYKRENYNVVGSCLSMILNMAITLFVFITLFTGLTEISQQKIYQQYNDLQQTYETSYQDDFTTAYSITTSGKTEAEIKDEMETKLQALIEAQVPQATADYIVEKTPEGGAPYLPTESDTAIIREKAKSYAYEDATLKTIVTNAQDKVLMQYDKIKDSWLWVENIWRPDTSVQSFADFDTFLNISNFRSQTFYTSVMNNASLTQADKDAQLTEWKEQYNLVTGKISATNTGWNGYYILVLLAGLITYFSASFSQRQSLKKQKEPSAEVNPTQGATKIMKWILPIVMIIFTISYSAAFAVYIVTNSIMSFIFSLIALGLFSKLDDKKEEQKKLNNKVDYSR